MLVSQDASAWRARSVVRACTAVWSRAQLAKPYWRASGSCALARVCVAETARMRSAAAVSPDCAARSRSRASRRRWSRLGRAGRSAMTSPSPACDPRGRPTREIAGVLLPDQTEVDYVLPADPEAPSDAYRHRISDVSRRWRARVPPGRYGDLSPRPDPSHALDHIVVIMFENRSFDNLLGRLYQPGEVASFAGVAGPDLSNPAPGGGAGAGPPPAPPAGPPRGAPLQQPPPPPPPEGG